MTTLYSGDNLVIGTNMEEIPVENLPVNNPQTQIKGKSLPILIIVLIAAAVLISGVIAYIVFLSPKAAVKTENSQPSTSKKVDQVNILLNQPISGIYPEIPDENNDESFNTNIFDGLVNYRNGKIVNALAESYITVNPSTWRFNLRKGVTFSNGAAFTSKDVKFSIDQAIQNKWPIFSPLTQIASTTVIDDYAIEFKTSKPVPALINLLSGLPILSKEQYLTKTKTDHAIGTGPYKLVSFDTVNQKVPDSTGKMVDNITDETIILEANPNYFGEKPKINKLTYRYLNDTSLAKLSTTDLKTKFQLVDGLTDLPNASYSALLAANYKKIEISQPTVRTIFINVKSGQNKYVSTATNPFADQKVRKAIYLTLDASRIIKEATIEGKPATQLVSSFIFGYNPNITRSNPDLETAKSLMKEAGFEKGFTTTLDLPGNRVAQGEAIARQLASIGITVTVNPLEKGPGLQKLLKSDYALFFSAWASDYFDSTTTFTEALATKGIQNYTNTSNKAIDDKVTEINSLQDPIARQKSLQEAMLIVMEDLSWVPLWEEQTSVYVAEPITYNGTTAAITGYGIGVK